MAQLWHGIVTATPTPFTATGDLDEPRLRDLIAHYLDAGVHGISVAGSQGEFYALDDAERVRVIEVAVQTVAGRVPVYAGTGGVSTRQTVALTRAAEAAGADVALVITPYFARPDAEELVEHFRQVAAATSLPVLLYNNPPRTGVNLSPATYLRCAEAGNVIGVKDSSGDLSQAIEYLLGAGGDRVVFAGRDTLLLALLTHGGAGAVSPAACVFPTLMVRAYEAFRAGRVEEARRVTDALAPLRWAWALGSFPVVIKEAMALVGLDPGPPRRPIAPLGPTRREELARIVAPIQALADLPAATAR